MSDFLSSLLGQWLNHGCNLDLSLIKAFKKIVHVLLLFAFDTFGALAPDAVRFLKRVQQVVSCNTAHVKGHNFVFSRVGFAIQKGLAAQLVARLPAVSL
ncbi:hypothetical protein Hanom_Chr03g00197471 [Helianthus anomalus]